MVIVEKGARVEDVGGASGGDGDGGAEDVVDASAQEAEDSKGRVERRVGVVGSSVVLLAAPSHPSERVEHARTAETDRRDYKHLKQRRVPGEFPRHWRVRLRVCLGHCPSAFSSQYSGVGDKR
eukprot:TRINITY_DN31344_c0_g1_i1.p3 TRINITY_DN31344_c0_g1~~TRINITY_DN31344_c0_g1_i1.p3  ORF type:complete len:123 (-),score=6.15 TRINITY_DN31344_c0_g1_i1:8-376(-)